MKFLKAITKCVERAHICPGNPQPELVDIVDKRGGLSTSDKLAFVDSAGEVVDIDGRLYGRTVRRSDCELLCAHKSSYPR